MEGKRKEREREKKGGEREKEKEIRGRNSVILCSISKEIFIVPQVNMRTELVHNKALWLLPVQIITERLFPLQHQAQSVKTVIHLDLEGTNREKFWRRRRVLLCFFLRLMGKHTFYVKEREMEFRKQYPN